MIFYSISLIMYNIIGYCVCVPGVTFIPMVIKMINPILCAQMLIRGKVSMHRETVVLLFQLKQKPGDYINVTIELDDMDVTSAVSGKKE